MPLAALATGGTARALRKVVGEALGPEELALASRRIAKRSSRELAKANDLDRTRARTLPAGVLVLAAVQRRLCVPFVVSRAGLREGVALELLAKAARRLAFGRGMYWPGTKSAPVVSKIRAAPFLSTSAGPKRSSTTSPCVQRAGVVPFSALSRPRTASLDAPSSQLLAFLDLDSERRGERFDRLYASHIRARAHAIDAERDQCGYEPLRLLPPALVEGPQAIVAAPPLSLASAGVADDDGSVAQTVLSKEVSTSRSRAWVSRSTASGSSSQRTSSISSSAEN